MYNHYAANLREEAKLLKYFQAYKQLDDIHFEPFVVEWRRTRGKGPGNIQEDLQSYHPSNGTKWIVNSVFLEVETPCHSGENHAL